ncbi:HlyD family efflux transporter periplasmic adaptor subunit [Roseomonas sp. SSH11]|uniref:HlyD family efflux transporter periplasmic adaptor subunit n=1 Tax=Pararoseomonas baculiformis TaxID=2820812 RepID=A0ABS4AE39_9PROT|nr:HlyD family efflux transporter periplasmic adaptor subunit [Pararoseomonas baculiformis]MBP0445281.1 HlyD family efflux transporter periplasmic adaptor subunit [Pararoseomonas baculiformis]
MSKILKIVAGLALVIAAIYAILGEQLAGTSTDATVNAQVVTIRSPIDGDLTLNLRTLGMRVGANQLIGTVRDPRPDETRLLELQRNQTTLTSDRDRIRDIIARLDASRGVFERQAAAYVEGRVDQLEARLAETRALQQAAEARAREASATLQRGTELNRSGIQTAAELSRVRSAYEVATQDVEAARQRARYLTVELAAARQGISLGDSYSDMPYSRQRLREIDLRVAELTAEANEREQRLKTLAEQIDAERVRLGRFQEARLVSPSPGILWEIMAANQEYVRRAQDVVRMVDCSTAIVTASVRETVYNGLRVGDPAQFRLLGDGRVFQATVARLAGSGASSIYRNLAVGASPGQLTRFDVALTVPELAADPELGCAIGRTGRVVFSGRPLDFWRRLRDQAGF